MVSVGIDNQKSSFLIMRKLLWQQWNYQPKTESYSIILV
jgi:hypothetical protein